MGLYINSNIGSLNAQRKLTSTTTSLTRSFERLSSGLRINSARDDAAGLSISTRFTAQIRGLNQAIRNSNDGISLAQTAEGALNETTNILQRVRELAVQSANDTNNDSDRNSLQAEVDQLKQELDRIASTTNFNGNQILNGDFLAHNLQVGANVGEVIDVSIDGSGSSDLARQVRFDVDFVSVDHALNANEFSITSRDGVNTSIRAASAADDQTSTSLNATSAIAKARAINSSTEFTGVRAIVGETSVTGTTINAVTLDGNTFMVINDEKISGFAIQENDANGALRDAINAVSDRTGVVATVDQNNFLELTAADGRNIEVDSSAGGLAGLDNVVSGGRITFQSDEQFDMNFSGTVGNAFRFNSNIGVAAGTAVMGVNSDNAVSAIDISTREGAVVALDIIDLALEDVSSSRADLGALQNRLESTINNLSTTSENLSASRSRILDADFAAETAQLSRNQIIQQAGVSILAQANQQPQIALSLLG
jgi:flagellin